MDKTKNKNIYSFLLACGAAGSITIAAVMFSKAISTALFAAGIISSLAAVTTITSIVLPALVGTTLLTLGITALSKLRSSRSLTHNHEKISTKEKVEKSAGSPANQKDAVFTNNHAYDALFSKQNIYAQSNTASSNQSEVAVSSFLRT